MTKSEQRLFHGFDWLLFAALLLLSGAGIVAIWSTTGSVGLDTYFGRQVIYLVSALVLFFIVTCFDYRRFSDFIVILYLASIAGLGLVLLLGVSIHGNKSWINLGILSVQPSELVKIVVIVALARYYAGREGDYLEFRELLTGGLIVLVPAALVKLQGDLGTAITFVPIYAALSAIAGIRRKHLVVLILAAAVAAPLTWFVLKDYQRDRIETVFNPSSDPQRFGYQTIQSQIAVGSGGLLGKGFGRGSQGHLGFLPARFTDFVFAVLAEEKGFVGSIAVLGLFLLVTFRLFRTASEARDKIGALIGTGVLALLLFHLSINVGMVVGLLPIVGIPLPFVSAGGSSLISFFIGMGLCMGVRMRRYVN
jgi:rod shape determining protein RodA